MSIEILMNGYNNQGPTNSSNFDLNRCLFDHVRIPVNVKLAEEFQSRSTVLMNSLVIFYTLDDGSMICKLLFLIV